MVENLSQLKKCFAEEKPSFKIEKHCRPECIGEIRKVSKTQSNGFYSTMPSVPESKNNFGNSGDGIWLEYGKADRWTFENGVCSIYLSNKHEEESLVMSFTIML